MGRIGLEDMDHVAIMESDVRPIDRSECMTQMSIFLSRKKNRPTDLSVHWNEHFLSRIIYIL